MLISRRTKVTLLSSRSVICQSQHCAAAAEYLLQTGPGGMSAHCHCHAEELAAEFDVELPGAPAPFTMESDCVSDGWSARVLRVRAGVKAG
jgi:hypothetical protein